MIQHVKVPLGFRSLQQIDLTAWDKTVNSPQLNELVKHIVKFIGRAPNSSIKEDIERVQEFFIKLLDYDTGLISTIVRLIRKEDTIIDSHLFRANSRAYRFYGYASEPDLPVEASLL